MKTKVYLVLYYLSFIITILALGYAAYYYVPLFELGEKLSFIDNFISYFINNLLIVSIINLMLIIVFTVLLLKKEKIVVDSLVFPISYILFLVGIMIICYLFNNKVALEYMHYGYYQKFIMIDYIMLNVYSLFLFERRKVE